MNQRLAETFVVALLAGCTACDRLINVPPMRRYAEKLVSTSGVTLKVGRCAMLSESRKGYCLLEGSASDIASFATGLKLAPTPSERVYGDLSCLALSDFGKSDDTALVTRAGIKQLAATGALPPNTDNVRLVAVYAGPTSVCVEMEYPYG